MTTPIAVTTVKMGDTRPLTWRVGADLTGVTSAEIHVRHSQTLTVTTLAATIVDAEAGVVEHVPDGTLAVGIYSLEIECTGPGERTFTAPSDGYATLWVQDDIA